MQKIKDSIFEGVLLLLWIVSTVLRCVAAHCHRIPRHVVVAHRSPRVEQVQLLVALVMLRQDRIDHLQLPSYILHLHHEKQQ